MTTSSSQGHPQDMFIRFEVPSFWDMLAFPPDPFECYLLSPSSHTARRGARSEGGDECRAYVLLGHEVPRHCPWALRSGRRGFRVCVRAPRSAGTGRGSLVAWFAGSPALRPTGKEASARAEVRDATWRPKLPVLQPMCALYVHAESLQSSLT